MVQENRWHPVILACDYWSIMWQQKILIFQFIQMNQPIRWCIGIEWALYDINKFEGTLVKFLIICTCYISISLKINTILQLGPLTTISILAPVC